MAASGPGVLAPIPLCLLFAMLQVLINESKACVLSLVQIIKISLQNPQKFPQVLKAVKKMTKGTTGRGDQGLWEWKQGGCHLPTGNASRRASASQKQIRFKRR
jgi:hypothetical protein